MADSRDAVPDFPIITTPRLRLREFADEDAVIVQRLAGDRRIADTTLHIPHPYPDGVAEAWIATRAVAWDMGQGLALAITWRATDELVGAIGLNIDAAARVAELGYWIGVPWWGQGIATEAVRALIDFGFTQLDLERIHAHHFARNPASGRVLQKAGMEFEGIRVDAIVKWGRPEDARFYGISRPDWERRRQGE
jgi:[ribosomal protein S5]-alanine N-acetyltransferase